MRPRSHWLLVAALLPSLAGGCGTVVNLTSPPPPGPPGELPSSCFAFGGVTRSYIIGGMCMVSPLCGGNQEIGHGGLLLGAGTAAAGLAIVAVDVPLSLVGDVVTLPIAVARCHGMPWATWWGEKSWSPDKTSGDKDGTAPSEPPAAAASGQTAASPETVCELRAARQAAASDQTAASPQPAPSPQGTPTGAPPQP